MHKVLVIEDDAMMSDMLAMYLSEEGYVVRQAGNADGGLAAVLELVPDIVLLDLMLPDRSGMELCGDIRRLSNVPIIVVSMKSEVLERVHALHAGADDYLVKPFSLHELTARMKALIRRSTELAIAKQPADKEWGNGGSYTAAHQENASEQRISLDIQRRAMLVQGNAVETTFSEFEIMKLFLANPGKVFSREDLINAIRGFDSFVTDRAIDVHIVNLRRKIEANPKEPRFIRTVWGVGYKYMNGN